MNAKIVKKTYKNGQIYSYSEVYSGSYYMCVDYLEKQFEKPMPRGYSSSSINGSIYNKIPSTRIVYNGKYCDLIYELVEE